MILVGHIKTRNTKTCYGNPSNIYETPEILRSMIFSTVSCLQSDNGVSTSNKIPGIFDTSCAWCIRTFATKSLQGKTNHSLMTAPGVNNTSPPTCFYAYHIHVLYATTGKIARTVVDTHLILAHVMPGWVVGQQDYAEIREYM